MRKIQAPHQALPRNGPDPHRNPALLLLRLKTALQLPLSSHVNRSGLKKDLPLKGKKTICSHPQQAKGNFCQPE